MSKLLSALTQPEPHPSVQSSALGLTGMTAGKRTATATVFGSSWRVAALCFAIPIIGVLVYAGVDAQRAPQSSPQPQNAVAEAVTPLLAGNASQAAQRPISTPFYPAGIERLSYPEWYTEPLPRLHSGSHRYAAPAPASEAVPVTRQGKGSTEADVTSIPEQKTVPSAVDSWDLGALDYSDLSPELAASLRSAIAATTEDDEPLPQLLQEEREGKQPSETVSDEPEAIAIGALPVSVQNRIPALNFQTHIYSSTADSRWVKVNGKEAFEGDEIAPGVVLRHIEPRAVVFDFDSYLISMPALSEW